MLPNGHRSAALLISTLLCLATGVARGQQFYDDPDWAKYGVSTHPLNLSSTPQGTGVQDSSVVYSPARIWDVDAIPAPHYFEGYKWVKETYTDSAAAATALATGRKSYNNAINWSDLDAPITPTIIELAAARGMKTGTISSVQWSHATPAGLSNAHNRSRNNYAAIATEMVYGTGGTPAQPGTPVLDVIMGAGHPAFDDNGAARASLGDTRFVGGPDVWANMGGGAGGTTSSGFQVFHTRTSFEDLATTDATSGRYLGIPEVGSTLQQGRSGASPADAPYADPLNLNVPTLETMTRAALNILDGTSQNPNTQGFLLHVEAGAVDWASHANTLGRMIEEQIDFNNSVQAVDSYLNANTNGNNWSNTLVLLTADHETGFLLGPDAATVAYDGLVNQGAGVMPLHRYMSGSHTNALVPLYAKGPGSELLASLVDGLDSQMVGRYGLWQGFDRRYVDNTDIFTTMMQAVDDAGLARNVILMVSDGAGFNAWTATTMYQYGVPEPATLALLGLGTLCLLSRRR